VRSRYLEAPLEELCFADRKIALLSGPRQCGKTTLAKRMLKQRGAGAYYNWDQTEFRRRWAQHPQSVVEVDRRGRVPLVVLDEIHKARLWKRTLKGIYDTLERPTDLFVTGSARLAVYRRGSDSLLGRYRSMRLHPFSLAELARHKLPSPDDACAALFEATARGSRHAEEVLGAMLEHGPFPEPLLAQDSRKTRLWRRERIDAVVREDLRDLSRIIELDRVQMLVSLLPERVGSLLSVDALREDLEVSHDTARRWLKALAELYYCYEIRPFARRIRRSIRKRSKLYLWDFGEVVDPASRFENLVAAHLLKACQYWSDAGYGDFELCYVRNRDGRELDFLVTRDRAPWLPVEAKVSDRQPSPAWRTFLPFLRCDRALQVVREPRVHELHEIDGVRLLVASAADALRRLV